MSRSYWPLKLEKDIDPNKIKNGERHRKSKHSKFHEEVSDLLQDACLRDSFIVEGKDRISSLMNKKDGSFKTKNGHEIYFFTRIIDKEQQKTRFFVKNIAERIPDGEWPWGSPRWEIKNFEECPCQDCRTKAKAGFTTKLVNCKKWHLND
jgi:hypothetical protein